MGQALRDYHESTKHSPVSLALSAHSLDRSNKPLPFKIYTSLEGIPVPGAIGQELGASAAADVYFLSDLDAVLERFGDRGYRVAQIAGGSPAVASSWRRPRWASGPRA